MLGSPGTHNIISMKIGQDGQDAHQNAKGEGCPDDPKLLYYHFPAEKAESAVISSILSKPIVSRALSRASDTVLERFRRFGAMLTERCNGLLKVPEKQSCAGSELQ